MYMIVLLMRAFILLLRGPALIVGFAMILDGLSNPVTEQLQVDRHSTAINNASGDSAFPGAQYTVDFIGDKPRTCWLDDSVRDALHDGDNVTLLSSGALHQCLEIRRGDVTIKSPFSLWKWCTMIGGLFCIGMALFGNIVFDDNDVTRFAFRFGLVFG